MCQGFIETLKQVEDEIISLKIKSFFPFFKGSHCVIISELSCQSHSMFTLNIVSFRQEKVEPLFENKLPPRLFLQTLELWCTV